MKIKERRKRWVGDCLKHNFEQRPSETDDNIARKKNTGKCRSQYK
jgi:hypothetical protein